MPNSVVHFEIPAEDLERARTFYADVFGWGITPVPDFDYTFAITGPTPEGGGVPSEPGFINGGMFTRTADLTSPIITLGVDDIDKSLETIGANGGSTVSEKMPVGDMGFAAYFKDSEGNVVGLWQNAG
jgi:uncharacterized protein